MRIAIIGAGNVGTAIASGAVRAGHEVVLSATTPQKAARVAAEVGASSAADNVEAARGADVVVLAVPWTAAREITEEIGSTVGNGVVIDATNPLTSGWTGSSPGTTRRRRPRSAGCWRASATGPSTPAR